MSARLGTVAPIGFSDFPPAQWLGMFGQLGCSVVQAYRNQTNQPTHEAIAQALADGNLPCDSLHGVFGERFDPSSPDEATRQFAIATYKAEGALVTSLGGDLVVVHCSTSRKEGIDSDEHSKRFEQLRRSIIELGAHGQQTGVRYAFENLPAYHAIGSNVAELADVLRQLQAPFTGMCLDIGHANMVSDAPAAIRAAGDQVIYVHLSDNADQKDQHLMPGCGTLDIDAVADALADIGYSGTIMLEVFASLERLAELSADGLGDRLTSFMERTTGKIHDK